MSGSIRILPSRFTQSRPLQLAPGIKAGFPSPATDYLRDSLDFNRDLIRNPEATFFGRMAGDSMTGAGLDDGDLAQVNTHIHSLPFLGSVQMETTYNSIIFRLRNLNQYR